MRRNFIALLLAAFGAAFLLPSVANATCTGVFAPGTVCGTLSGGVPKQLPLSIIGAGNVNGPAGAVTNDAATFSDTTGLNIKDSGVSLGSTTANKFLATPSASTGVPSLRLIAPADLPLGSSSQFGAVKVDGSTITASGGVISAGAANVSCTQSASAGFVGNGTTANDTAWSNWVASLPASGGCIQFAPGKFLFNAQTTYSFANQLASISILGSGQDLTFLFFPSSSNGVAIVAANTQNTFHIRDLSVITGATGSGGAGIVAQYGLGNPINSISDITSVYVGGDTRLTDYWTLGVAIQGWSNINFDRLVVIGAGTGGTGLGLGISLANHNSNVGVIYNITNCVFYLNTISLDINPNIQGVVVNNTNFTSMGTGIDVEAGGGTTGGQLVVTNSQFGLAAAGTTVNDIIVNSEYGDIMIANNFLEISRGGSAIDLAQSFGYTITGNNVFQPFTADVGHGNGIVIGGTTPLPGAISANAISSASSGLVLSSGSTNVNVQGNTFSGNTAAISSAGTASVISNNLGYNPVGVSVY